jgi:hypothetical protein
VSESEHEYDVQELIDSEVTLTHWTGPEGTRVEETSLSVDGRVSGLLSKALRAADAVADPDTAALLLRPFRIESLTDAQVESFAKIVGGRGQQWTADLLRTWFGGDHPAWAYGGGQERPRWVADSLPALCEGLHATGSVGTPAAQRLVDLAWEWLGRDIGAGLTSSSPSHRDEKLGGLGKPLASVLRAAAMIGAVGTRDMVTACIREQGDAVTALEMSALRAAAELSRDGTRGDAGFGDLAADCAARLRSRLARPRRASGDWSIELPTGGCTCELCDTLRAFLNDKGRRTFEWPLGPVESRCLTGVIPKGAGLWASELRPRLFECWLLVAAAYWSRLDRDCSKQAHMRCSRSPRAGS